MFPVSPFPPATDLAATWWQYVVLFLAVTASWAGVPCIGAVAAGAAGLAASQGRLNLVAVLLLSIAGGEVGGLIGYRIGVRWGRVLVERPGKHQAYRRSLLVKGEEAYTKWGRFAVFVTPSIVSGTAKMPHRQFVLWNLVDAIGFTLLTVAGAYGVGRLVTGDHAIKDVGILVVGVGLGTLALVLARRHHKGWVGRREVSGTPR
jgi:membrane protein DedA with SNARE-associated domain